MSTEEALEARGEASSAMGDLSTRSKDTQAAALSLGMLNEAYRSRQVEGMVESTDGRGVLDEEERPSLAPETPQKADRPNPGEQIM